MTAVLIIIGAAGLIALAVWATRPLPTPRDHWQAMAFDMEQIEADRRSNERKEREFFERQWKKAESNRKQESNE